MVCKLIFIFSFQFFTCISLNGFGQPKKSFQESYSLHFGYGVAGSFFVRSYVENEIPGIVSFLKKNFAGTNLNVGLTRSLGKKYEIAFSYCRQDFQAKVSYQLQQNNVLFILDNHSIRHINNLYDLTVRRKFTNNGRWLVGIGLYYLRPIQQEIFVYQGSTGAQIEIQDRNHKNSRLNEGGALIDFAYEWNFQQRVSLGLKSQFYFTLSASTAESITLFPFIKILF